MMALAPASASISAEISPVLAPNRLGVAILRADAERLRAACLFREGRNQGRRRANQQIGLAGDIGCARQHGLEFGRGRLQAVHLPVAGNQRPDSVGHVGIPLGNVWVRHALAERGGQFQMPDLRSLSRHPLQLGLRPRLRRSGGHFMMLYQLGDPLLRNSIPNSLGRDPVPSCKQVGPMLFEECGKPHQTGSARP